jgi:hypothetical protein
MATASVIVTLVAIMPLDSEGFVPMWLLLGIYLLLLGLAGASHLAAMFSDPGSLNVNSEDAYGILME